MSLAFPPAARRTLAIPLAVLGMLIPAGAAHALTPAGAGGVEQPGRSAPALSLPDVAPDDLGPPATGLGRRI